MRVVAPAITRAAFADHTTELPVRKHICPRHRRAVAGSEPDHILIAVGGKTAATIVEQQLLIGILEWPAFWLARQVLLLVLDQRRKQWRRHRFRQAASIDLIAQAAIVVADDDARDRLQQHAILMRHLLRRTHKDAARTIDHVGLDAGGDQAHDLILQLLAVAGLVLVPDHQIHGEAFQPPVRVRLHDLPHQFDIVRIGDLQQHDRQVAGNRMAPQSGLATPILQQHRRVGAQRTVRINHQPGEPLVQLRIGLGRIDLPPHHLAVRPGQIEDAIGESTIAIFVDQARAVIALIGQPEHLIDLRGRAGFQGDPAADRNDRIQHRALAVRQPRIGGERLWSRRRIAAPDETRAVGFVGDFVDVRVVHRQQMEHPRRRFAVRPGPARAQDRLLLRQQRGLHEQVAERRMQVVGDRRCQHHFGIRRDLDGAPRTGAIGDAQAAQFDVVLWRNRDLGMAVEVELAAAVFGFRIGEDRAVVFHRHAGRLMRARPEFATGDITQVTECAPVIAGGIFAPARHRQHVAGAGAALAEAAARAGQHQVIAAVGQHLQCRQQRGRGGEHAQAGFADIRRRRQSRHFGGVRMEHRDARDAFLQQQQCRLQFRIGDEAFLHRLIEQQIRQREQPHALVMRHERADQHAVLAARQSRGRVVDRLVKTESAQTLLGCQPLQILAGRFRRHHQREHAGVRRDHQILREPAFQPQPGHAECAVLIIELRIDGVVTAFGDAPRHAAMGCIIDLAFDRRLRGLVEQRVLVTRHHQLRHQVFEHRAAPRQQHRLAVGRAELAAEREPGLLRKLALRDRDEAAQPRFRGEQIVITRIEPAFLEVVTDREQMAATVVQEVVIHLCERTDLFDQFVDIAQTLLRARDRSGQRRIRIRDRLPGSEIAQGRQRRCSRRRGKPAHLLVHVTALLPQCLRPVDSFAAAQGEFAFERGRLRGQRVQIMRTGGRIRRRCRACCIQLAGEFMQCRHRVAVERFAQHAQRFLQTIPDAGTGHRRVGQRQQALAQGQQMAGEVAAIDGGDVARTQRLQRAGVVPVVEMPAISRQRLQCAQRGGSARQQRACADVAKVAGGQIGQQGQSDIGRRSAMRDGLRRVFLHIVWRQPVVFGAGEGLEECPGAPRQASEKRILGRREFGAHAFARPAQPPHHSRRYEPEREDRCSDGERIKPQPCQPPGNGKRNDRRECHAAQRIAEAIAEGALDFAGWAPLQQMPARNRHPPQRASDRIETELRLVRQASQGQRRARETAETVAPHIHQMGEQRHLGRLAQQIHQRRQQRRHQQDRKQPRRPCQRQRGQRPAQQQQRQHRRRHQAAAQVVEDLAARQQGQRIAFATAILARRARQQPRQQLPVAANPALPAFDIGRIARRVILVQLHIADQASAGVAAFQQIVAEDAVVGKSPAQRAFERIDCIDALADERAFAEQILIHVRHRTRVRVDARLAAVQLRIARQ